MAVDVEFRTVEPRVLMANNLSPEDARDIAHSSRAGRLEQTPAGAVDAEVQSSYIRYGDGVILGIAHGPGKGGRPLTGVQLDLGKGEPLVNVTDQAIALGRSYASLVDVQVSNGEVDIVRRTFKGGRLFVNPVGDSIGNVDAHAVVQVIKQRSDRRALLGR